MSDPNENDENATEGIDDDQLPPDVRPGEDNPLAEGPTDEDEDEGVDLTQD